MAKKAENKQKITALYCRLSVEDIKDDDKNSKRKVIPMSRTVSQIKW